MLVIFVDIGLILNQLFLIPMDVYGVGFIDSSLMTLLKFSTVKFLIPKCFIGESGFLILPWIFSKYLSNISYSFFLLLFLSLKVLQIDPSPSFFALSCISIILKRGEVDFILKII